MVGVTEAGSTEPTVNDLVQNMDEYIQRFAPSGRNYVAGLTMYDSVETFFAEGGNRLYIGRVHGAAAVAASVDLDDNAAATALTVDANSVGEWGNNIDIVVRTTAQDDTIPSGSFRIRIVDETTSEVLDESYDLVDSAAAIQWSFGNRLVQITGGTSLLDPVAGTFDLVGGSNDVGAINDASWQAGFDSLSAELGPGILVAPGATTNTLHNTAAEAARRDNRIAFLDGPDTPTPSTLITSAKAVIDASLKRSRFAGFFAPWLLVPGLTTGTVKKVPPSPAVAGVFARNMSGGHSANEPAAGALGVLRTALDMTQVYTDAERQNMNNNGVNILRDIFGQRKVYGWRSTADPVNDARWIALSNSILHRQIVALLDVVGEEFIFRQIDGQGHLFGELAAALTGSVFMPMYFAGELYGTTMEEAFKVDTGPSVNTDATAANNELRAVCSVRMAPFGEEVDIEIVKYLVTEAIPA